MIKRLELSNKQGKDGMRDIRIVLHEIYPEDTFSEDGTGSKTNLNGLAWREKWVAANKDSVIDKSIRVEFLDDERIETWGHGATDIGADMLPHFEDATVIGHFKRAEIENIDFGNGDMRRCLVGYGVVDAMCYPAYVEKLEADFESGEVIHGSVEIIKDSEHETIVYENGYHEESRTPQFYQYSGYAILSIKEADPSAVLLEINENKEESNQMTAEEIKSLVEQTVSELNSQASTIEQLKADCEAKIAEANEARDAAIAEKNELSASAEQIQTALNEAREEISKKYEEIEALYTECETLRKELGEAKARERVGEMNEALSKFTKEEKACVSEELKAFESDPMSVEINSVVSKIYEQIGKTAKAAEANVVVAETNSAKADVEDIFGAVEESKDDEDTSIF